MKSLLPFSKFNSFINLNLVTVVLVLNLMPFCAFSFQKVDITPLLNQLGIEGSTLSKTFSTQKVMPNDTTHSIVVLPIEKPDMEVQVMYYDVQLLVVNNQTGAIRSKALFENAYISDAVGVYSLTIDTAPYRLSPGVRAFGLNAAYKNNSRANPYYGQELSLFIEEGGKIIRVLKDFTTERYNGENNSIIGKGLTLEATDRNTILIMTKAPSNGFYNIKTQTKIQETKTQEDKVVKDSSYQSTGLLRFNGKAYEIIKK